MTTHTDKATDIKAELRNYANDVREFLNPDSEMTDRPSLHPARADEAADRITALEADLELAQRLCHDLTAAQEKTLDQNDALAAEVERLRMNGEIAMVIESEMKRSRYLLTGTGQKVGMPKLPPSVLKWLERVFEDQRAMAEASREAAEAARGE